MHRSKNPQTYVQLIRGHYTGNSPRRRPHWIATAQMSQFRRRVSLLNGLDAGNWRGTIRLPLSYAAGTDQPLDVFHLLIGQWPDTPGTAALSGDGVESLIKASPPITDLIEGRCLRTTLAGWIDCPLQKIANHARMPGHLLLPEIVARSISTTRPPTLKNACKSWTCIPVTYWPFSRTSSKSLSSVPPAHEYSSPSERRSLVRVEGIDRQRRLRTTQRAAPRTGIQLEASTKAGRISPVSRVNGRTRNRPWPPAFSFDLCGNSITRLLLRNKTTRKCFGWLPMLGDAHFGKAPSTPP